MTKYNAGFYPVSENDQLSSMVMKAYSSDKYFLKRKVHKAYHFFGLETLKYLLSNVGFHVEKLYYSAIYDDSNIQFSEPINPNEQYPYRISIIAKKL